MFEGIGFELNCLTCVPHLTVAMLWTGKRAFVDKNVGETNGRHPWCYTLEPLVAGLAACTGLFLWNIPLCLGMSSNQYDGVEAWVGSSLAVGFMEALG